MRLGYNDIKIGWELAINQNGVLRPKGDRRSVSEPCIKRRLAGRVELRQAVTRKQWVWEDAGAWRSPFLFVFGDDRVIRYTGADVDTGGAEDVQMAE
ncbi:hypothetical protein DEO72_LG10g2067 [Vigna unguiculata]|uniref:Uncharacterized protein n=1 Tax=Vigna unguiculata TaxID=3917 RepID=A0A4D6NF81_VIGUN|nr:hypothetical protein DEO72_LG10g2067 [Vigna unguiculata]